MSTPCQQVRAEYQDLQTLKEEFVLQYQQALKTGDLDKAKQLKVELEQRRDLLTEKLWPLEKLTQQEFHQQYESQKAIFERVGILEKLSTGQLGIKAIDGQKYPFPTSQEVSKMIRENKEILKFKTKQGFTNFLITPFGMSLDQLAKIYGQLIIKHFQAGKLVDSEDNQITNLRKQGEGDNVKNDAAQDTKYYPLWKWESYTNADRDGKIVYDVQEFSTNHQGKTKKEILQQTPNKQGAFAVLLTEDLPNIPRQDQEDQEGQKEQETIIGGRQQLKAGLTPNQYLETSKTDPQYQHESGMTPEDQLIYAILHLEKTNQVIDDYSGKGSASYQLGAYFPVSGFVPDAYWDRGNRQAFLLRNAPGYSDSVRGARLAVRVKKT